jgi:GNAT superfamily N-acetyltransferase
LTFHEVRPQEETLHDVLVGLFVQLFPAYRRYVPHIQASLRLGERLNPHVRPHHVLVTADGTYAGFLLFNYLKRYNVGFGRYVGVLPAYQGRGAGTLMHDWALECIRGDAQDGGREIPLGLCTEVDAPETAPNVEERTLRERRLGFFQRYGAIGLDVDYREPAWIRSSVLTPEEAIRPQPMRLLLFPIRPVTSLSKAQTRHVVEGILLDHYLLEKNSPFVQSVIRSVGRTAEKEST